MDGGEISFSRAIGDSCLILASLAKILNIQFQISDPANFLVMEFFVSLECNVNRVVTREITRIRLDLKIFWRRLINF